jgi:heme exporter protein A
MSLQSRQLALSRGGRVLVEHVDIDVPLGQALHVRGRNGCGKTSLLRALCGLAPVHAGQLHWQGQPYTQQREALRQTLLYIGHGPGLKDDLTLGENLRTAAALSGRACSAAQARSALARLGLGDRIDAPVRTLSQGQRRRGGLARLALWPATQPNAPRLLVLDEPFNALDRQSATALSTLLDEHLAAGAVLVYTTHQEAPALVAPTQVLDLDRHRVRRAAVPSATPIRQEPHREAETC